MQRPTDSSIDFQILSGKGFEIRFLCLFVNREIQLIPWRSLVC